MKIYSATLADLPRMETAALRFYASSRFLRKFSLAVFTRTWTGLLASGLGVIYVVEHEGEIVGALGGVEFPDPHTGERTASEFFWFVQPEHRGAGLRLYFRFEQWARERDCSAIRMVHLLDSMPEKLAHTYQRLGYTPAEVHYTKDLTQQ